MTDLHWFTFTDAASQVCIVLYVIPDTLVNIGLAKQDVLIIPLIQWQSIPTGLVMKARSVPGEYERIGYFKLGMRRRCRREDCIEVLVEEGGLLKYIVDIFWAYIDSQSDLLP